MDASTMVPGPMVPDQAIGVTATVGLYGSASTWVYNVMRELAVAHYGAGEVHATFSDSVQKVLEDPQARNRHIVWKLHQADRSWQTFAALSHARIVLTIRDPRDAVLSIMQRFGRELDDACGAMVLSLRQVVECAAAGHPWLRYEEGFFREPNTVAEIAQFMGCPVAEAEQARIFEAYSTAHVKQFGAELETLPQGRLKSIGGWTRYDEVTQIHQRHIGDQRVGKWRDQLDAAAQANVNDRFGPYLLAFGYPLD